MKKIISLLLVIVLLLAIPGAAMASAPSKADLHKTRVIAMRQYADRLVGKVFTGEVDRLFPIVEGKGAMQMEHVTRKAMFVSMVLIKAGAISGPLTSKRLYAATTKTAFATDAFLAFKVSCNGVSNVAICLNGYQYYVGKLNKVVREKYSSKDWNYVGIIPGL